MLPRFEIRLGRDGGWTAGRVAEEGVAWRQDVEHARCALLP